MGCLELTCDWCGADYTGGKLTLCRICQKTRAEQSLAMVQFLRRLDGIQADVATGHTFMISRMNHGE